MALVWTRPEYGCIPYPALDQWDFPKDTGAIVPLHTYASNIPGNESTKVHPKNREWV